MVGRFAQHVRPSSRGLSPRRARTLVVMLSVLMMGIFAVVATIRQSHALPNIALAATKTSLGKNSIAAKDAVRQIDTVDTIVAPKVEAVAASAEIITCPACRLNSLPKVKAFVHGDAKIFPRMKVTFEFGHDPTLYFYDANKKKTEEIDLAPMDAPQIMRTLYSHGIYPNTKSKSVTEVLGDNPTLQQ